MQTSFIEEIKKISVQKNLFFCLVCCRNSARYKVSSGPSEPGGGGGGAAQCFELKLRWRFYVNTSTFPETNALNNFWYFKQHIQTKICSESTLNIIEEIAHEKSDKLQFLKTIYSVIFLMFEKLPNFYRNDFKQDLYCSTRWFLMSV